MFYENCQNAEQSKVRKETGLTNLLINTYIASSSRGVRGSGVSEREETKEGRCGRRLVWLNEGIWRIRPETSPPTNV